MFSGLVAWLQPDTDLWGMPLYLALWTGVVLSIVLPFAFSSELRSDPLHLYSLLILKGLLFFGVPGFLVVVFPSDFPWQDAYPEAALLISSAFLLTWAGYASRLGPWVSDALPFVHIDARTRSIPRVVYRALLLAVFGLGIYAGIAQTRLGLTHFQGPTGGTALHQTFLQYLQVFGMFSFVLLLWDGLEDGIGGPYRVAALLGLVGIQSTVGAVSGGRTAFVIPAVVAGFVYHYRVKQFSWKAVAALLSTAILVVAPILTVWRRRYRSLLEDGFEPSVGLAGTALLEGTADLVSGSQSFLELLTGHLAGRFSVYVQGTIRVLNRVPEVHSHTWGTELITSIATGLVPRVLWPDKPVLSVGQDFAAKFFDLTGGTSISVGMPAEAYYHFSVIGLILFVLLGIFLRVLWERYQRLRSLEAIHIVRLYVILFVFVTLTKHFHSFVTGGLRKIVLLYAFLGLLGFAGSLSAGDQPELPFSIERR